jgi:hypothetical protein
MYENYKVWSRRERDYSIDSLWELVAVPGIANNSSSRSGAEWRVESRVLIEFLVLFRPITWPKAAADVLLPSFQQQQ